MSAISEIGIEIAMVLETGITKELKLAFTKRWIEEGHFSLLETMRKVMCQGESEDTAFATAMSAYWTGHIINQSQRTCQN
jgi:hypothetical protein